MFEYLMPELLMRSYENTLAGQSARNAVDCQMKMGRAFRRPWGVSESGYYAFDLNLQYQYRAFGIPSLGMRSDQGKERVIAPYATLMAYPFVIGPLWDRYRTKKNEREREERNLRIREKE